MNESSIVFKRIGDLEGYSGPLPADSAALMEISAYGHSYRIPVVELYGADWNRELAKPAADYVAPNADHADQADTCTLAADSERVNGLSLAAPTMTQGSRELAAGEVWTPPAGLWQFYRHSDDADDGKLVIEAQDASTLWLGRASLAGLVLTDGANIRIRNSASSSRWLLWHKLA